MDHLRCMRMAGRDIFRRLYQLVCKPKDNWVLLTRIELR